ncbi:MAG TPA: hypothetical protein VGL56_09355 [Fimbriimonadaceae bacterium]
MKYADLKVMESVVPLNGNRITVYRPTAPISRTFFSARSEGECYIFADFTGMCELATWAALAAISIDSIVWIPKTGDQVGWAEDVAPPCDLILSHHSCQLRASEWKDARQYADKGRGRTLSISIPEVDQEQRSNGGPRRYEERPLVHLHSHANTVFVSGDRKSFELMHRHFSSFWEQSVTNDHCHISGKDHETEDLMIMFVVPEDWKPEKNL